MDREVIIENLNDEELINLSATKRKIHEEIMNSLKKINLINKFYKFIHHTIIFVTFVALIFYVISLFFENDFKLILLILSFLLVYFGLKAGYNLEIRMEANKTILLQTLEIEKEIYKELMDIAKEIVKRTVFDTTE